jgi:hypothetical protein
LEFLDGEPELLLCSFHKTDNGLGCVGHSVKEADPGEPGSFIDEGDEIP